MAVSGKLDPTTVGERLGEWLERALDISGVEVTNVEIPAAGGFSAETLMFDASWSGGSGRYVARVQPDGAGLFPNYDVIAEARVIEALAGAVPVPTVVGAEPDPELLGSPFFVMERVDGRVPADDPPFTAAGWVIDELDAAGRRTLCENTIDAIVAVHGFDWQSAGLEFLAHPEDGPRSLDQYLAKLERFYDWASEGERGYPVIDATFEWLRANDPGHDDEPVLNWGDARLANVMYGDDLAVKAVLDWEMMSLNNRELEVAFFIWGQRHHTEGLGVPVPEGFLTPEETIARYEQVTGHKLEKVLDYYVPAAGLYSAVIFVRLGRLMVRAGLMPADAGLDRNSPSSMLLTRILGLGDTGAQAESWVGRR